MQGPEVVVPAGTERLLYPVRAPEWLETALTTRINLMAMVETKDPKGNKRFVTGVMDGQIVMSIEGALLKTTHESQERRVAPGGTLSIPVKVSRTPKLNGIARVELVPDADEPSLFTAEPIDLPVTQTTAVMKITVAKDPKISGLRTVVVRATVLQDGKWPAVSETQIPLIVQAPDSVAKAK